MSMLRIIGNYIRYCTANVEPFYDIEYNNVTTLNLSW